jgi:molybdate transport system substrate-binding protein
VEERLVLIAPESLADAPSSFESLRTSAVHVAVADHEHTVTGRLTEAFLRATQLRASLADRLYVASDAQGVIDHLLNGDADVAIVLPRDVARYRQRVRIVATSEPRGYQPVRHSIAMERYCPDRASCRDFLEFIQSEGAQAVLRRLGYQTPTGMR